MEPNFTHWTFKSHSEDLFIHSTVYILPSHISILLVPGHYISDVFDMKKQSWLTYNDLDVSRTQEAAVQRDRDRSGYIFFYMHKWVSADCYVKSVRECNNGPWFKKKKKMTDNDKCGQSQTVPFTEKTLTKCWAFNGWTDTGFK